MVCKNLNDITSLLDAVQTTHLCGRDTTFVHETEEELPRGLKPDVIVCAVGVGGYWVELL